MENPSKNNPDKKVNEPETVYKSKFGTIQVDAFDYLPAHVKERLEQALQESAKGLGKPHAQVMAEVKAKYNLS
jgi:hypothetical protein